MKTSCNSLAPTASRPVSPPLTSASWHMLARALLSPTCLANFYLSELFYHLLAWLTSICPRFRSGLTFTDKNHLSCPACLWRLLQCLISDGTVTVLPSTLRPQGQGQHLTCLPPWYPAQCLAHEERPDCSE